MNTALVIIGLSMLIFLVVDTIGQLLRYMGWIKKNKKDDGVKGVIVAGQFDTKLDHAKSMIPNSEVFLYEVDFKLKEYKWKNF